MGKQQTQKPTQGGSSGPQTQSSTGNAPGCVGGKNKQTKPRRTEDARAGAQGHPQKQGNPKDETPTL